MQSQEWILLDTETTGLIEPIYVVELAAQHMNGWEPEGKSFRQLINHDRDIPDDAQKVHGYTREILERDGNSPVVVYEDFREYAAGLPLVSYNKDYDLKQVLYPEWKRLGIEPIGTEGFCALELTQRLLDPVAAGNCKLQTLRQFYQLPERDAHSAMGDVETAVDLLTEVLRPMAEQRRLESWEDIVGFTSGLWFPSKLAFGKFKGRFFREAREDAELRDWLVWLSESKRERSSRMGQWYLEQLEKNDDEEADLVVHSDTYEASEEGASSKGENLSEPALIVYSDPGAEKLNDVIDGLRKRLAEVNAEYSLMRMRINYAQSQLFRRLRNLYERRDELRLQIKYRQKYIETLAREGDEEAKRIAEEFEKQRQRQKEDYIEAEKELEGKRRVSKDVRARIKKLWRKLSRLYHPDKHGDEPEKQEIFDKLQASINDAMERGDIDLLEEIEADPEGFVRSQGWGRLDLSQSTDSEKLKELVASLQARIMEIIEAMNVLESSPDYELHIALEQDLEAFEELVAKQSAIVEEEIMELQAEADELGKEIKQLTGKDALNT